MKNLNEKAKEILKMAEKYGAEQNFFFITTFKRYEVQIKVLEELEKTIEKEGMLISKEYVKGRKNVYSHPAVAEYNKTTDSANKTVTTLIRIVKSMKTLDSENNEEDLLMKVLNGGSVD